MMRRSAGSVLDLLPVALRLAREGAGLSAEEAAESADVSVQTIEHSERRGRPYPALETFFSLLESYGVGMRDLEDLLERAGQFPLEQRLDRLERKVAELEMRENDQ
jgi:transcriptional regulator with XRE-family HTH domain